MSQPELLKWVIKTLDKQEIPYMLTGSVVSSMYGEPRASHNIDVIVAITSKHINVLIETFPSDRFFLNKESIEEAIDNGGMFNLINKEGGDKVYFWMLTNNAFDLSRFKRKRTEKFLNINMKVQTPEDTILSKLKWAKDSGGSEKQYHDALRVFVVQGKTLDHLYMEEWAKKIDVYKFYRKIVKDSGL